MKLDRAIYKKYPSHKYSNMKIEMKVAAVVVTYNRLALLQQCVQHLLEGTAPCDILLVDNASTDGTKDWAHLLVQKNVRVQYRNTGKTLAARVASMSACAGL